MRLRTPSHLTAPTPRAVRSMQSDFLSATRASHVPTGSVKPRSFHGAFNQTQGFQICTDTHPYLACSASNQGTALAAEKLAENELFALNIHAAVRSKAQGERRLFFAHASCTTRTRARRLLVRAFASNFRALGTKRFWGMRRQSAFGGCL